MAGKLYKFSGDDKLMILTEPPDEPFQANGRSSQAYASCSATGWADEALGGYSESGFVKRIFTIANFVSLAIAIT